VTVNSNASATAKMQLPSNICSLCKSDLTIADPESGEIICNKCGMVISDKTQDSKRPESCDTFDTVEIKSFAGRNVSPTLCSS
jgi:transcription initiation factor TFIIIB Brf1 subunit/transcription initiation factor TFIIB